MFIWKDEKSPMELGTQIDTNYELFWRILGSCVFAWGHKNMTKQVIDLNQINQESDLFVDAGVTGQELAS